MSFRAPVLASLVLLLSSPSARATDLVLGLGRVHETWFENGFLKMELAGGVRQPLDGPLSVEARLGWSPGGPEARAKDIVHTAVGLGAAAEGGMEPLLVLYNLRLEALLDLAPERDRGRFSALPHLRAGLALEPLRVYRARYNTGFNPAADQYWVDTGPPTRFDQQGTRLRVPLVIEVAEELWIAERQALRLSAALLTAVEPEAVYDPKADPEGYRVTVRPRFGFELLFGLGRGSR